MLNLLQQELAGLYDLHTPHRVEDFLLQDAAVAAQLTGGDPAGDEQLLVQEDEDDLWVSLFLRERILGRLEADSPGDALHSGNLADFWLAVEGVSHFLHLVWFAGHRRAVTRLELELLAEIDKFVTAVSRLEAQTGSDQSRPVRKSLFQRFRLREDLSAPCRDRYQEANRLAARYCRNLERRFCVSLDDPALRQELRRFQRMGRHEKFRHIESGDGG